MANEHLTDLHAGATTERLADATAPGSGERELIVTVRPYGWDAFAFEGSRAQLEAEGVIPNGLKWPDGKTFLYWEGGRFRWSLGRTRPEGLKGPMSLWVNGDWWYVPCILRDRRDDATQRILDLNRELAEALYLQSDAGRRERNKFWQRYLKARDDMSYQAFKAMIVTECKKPGRKPKARHDV